MSARGILYVLSTAGIGSRVCSIMTYFIYFGCIVAGVGSKELGPAEIHFIRVYIDVSITF